MPDEVSGELRSDYIGIGFTVSTSTYVLSTPSSSIPYKEATKFLLKCSQPKKLGTI